MQLILAADVSGSVNPARYKTQQDGYLEALGDSRVLNVIAELDPPVLAIAFVAWLASRQSWYRGCGSKMPNRWTYSAID